MTYDELILEIGDEAYYDLTDTERAALMNRYTAAQSVLAGMHAFKILMRKAKCTYRMGKVYEDLNTKFAAYRQIYLDYCSQVAAGYNVPPTDGFDEQITLEKKKFLPDANEYDDTDLSSS